MAYHIRNFQQLEDENAVVENSSYNQLSLNRAKAIANRFEVHMPAKRRRRCIHRGRLSYISAFSLPPLRIQCVKTLFVPRVTDKSPEKLFCKST